LQAGDKESTFNWREFFKDLKRRGLKGEVVILGIMDGLLGLERVLRAEFQEAVVQRWQVHVAGNVLATIPRKLKKTIGDEVRSIVYASSRKKALEFFERFKARWEREIPSAVKYFERTPEACVTYLQFPEEAWACLRRANVTERVNRDLKRRTRPMVILAGENSCYMLLAFVCLEMEITWRSKPIGKAPNNLPFLKKVAENNFTQNN
jgi:putative transposase